MSNLVPYDLAYWAPRIEHIAFYCDKVEKYQYYYFRAPFDPRILCLSTVDKELYTWATESDRRDFRSPEPRLLTEEEIKKLNWGSSTTTCEDSATHQRWRPPPPPPSCFR